LLVSGFDKALQTLHGYIQLHPQPSLIHYARIR